MSRTASVSARFRRVVWAHYAKYGRHELPWRKTRDPYKILVSEVMLQQTQIERVIPFYAEFTRRFPSARTLAAAPLSDVLKAWQGLGYNRRAKMLHAAAKQLGKSDFPRTAAEWEQLPGVGKYTARAVAVFAYGADEILIETNIRTAAIHHFFRNANDTIYGIKITDAEIEEVLQNAQPKEKAKGGAREHAREWNYALMDYGAFLKRSGVQLNAKSKHYAKQSRFSGSLREARGALLKELARGSSPSPRLLGLLGDDRRDQLKTALAALVREGFVTETRGRYTLAE